MANKKIIELDSASQVNSDALFPLSQLVDSNQKTLKATVAQMQAAMLDPISDLVTLGESSGSIASFSTDIADKLYSCYVNVTAVQSGSGTPSPSNVRAISGWSECNLNVTGYNIWDEVWENGTINSTTGEDEPNANYIRSKNYIPIQPSTNYYYKTSAALRLIYYGKGFEFVGIANANNGVVESPANAYYVRFYPNSSTYGSTYKNDISINYPSTNTNYNKFGTTHNIPFNQTIYGGVLDVLSGVLTVTHGLITFDGSSDEIWSYSTDSGTGRRRVFIAINGAKPNSINLISNMLVTQGVVSGYPDEWKCSFNGNSTPSLIIGVDTSISSASDWTAYISSHNLVIVYELVTPTTIQLTPTEVKTILGQNNIFADCGDIDLKYLETIGNRL